MAGQLSCFPDGAKYGNWAEAVGIIEDTARSTTAGFRSVEMDFMIRAMLLRCC